MRAPTIRLPASPEEAKKNRKTTTPVMSSLPPPPPPPLGSSSPLPPPPPPASPALGTMELRTDESNPSHFQISIPSAQEVERYARICLLMQELENLSNTNITSVISSNSAPRRRSVIGAIQDKRHLCLGFDGIMRLPKTMARSPARRSAVDSSDTVSITSSETSFSDSDGSPTSLSSSTHGGARRKSLWRRKGSRGLDETKLEIVESIASMVDRLFSSVYDLTVEHCFIAPTSCPDGGSGEDSNHITVFSSDVLRQFIVCYNQQETVAVASPEKIRISEPLRKPSKNNCDPKSSKTNQQHQQENVDAQVHSVLEDLTSSNPFYDVVFCGHGAAAEASVRSSVRYAANASMIRVQSFTYGWTMASPLPASSLSQVQERSLAHALPNLCILRVENGHDLSLRGDENHGVGHVLQLDIDKNEVYGASPRPLSPRCRSRRRFSSGSGTCVDLIETSRLSSTAGIGGGVMAGGPSFSAPPSSPSVSEPARLSTPARIYKFGQDPATAKALATSFRGRALSRLGVLSPSSARGGGVSSGGGRIGSPSLNTLLRKGPHVDHCLTSYIASLECFTTLRYPWVKVFVGEEGDGIAAPAMMTMMMSSSVGDDETECRHVV